ncbi:hypothetical protein VTN77DRAFT_3039 [Rasamsonia byssochlamydoides]|uniref:uncharacterized protein n=1 Tax=Rasamsonia byssochlamydoides TaxID=89139 RepID=UPI0037435E77
MEWSDRRRRHLSRYHGLHDFSLVAGPVPTKPCTPHSQLSPSAPLARVRFNLWGSYLLADVHDSIQAPGGRNTLKTVCFAISGSPESNNVPSYWKNIYSDGNTFSSWTVLVANRLKMFSWRRTARQDDETVHVRPWTVFKNYLGVHYCILTRGVKTGESGFNFTIILVPLFSSTHCHLIVERTASQNYNLALTDCTLFFLRTGL